MTEPHASPPARYGGLDGLRAIAVVLVVIFHAFPAGPLFGGFVGVDVFFVISGFLITALLLREARSNGRIDLWAFWRRRARRLLPALVTVVTVCASLAWVIGGDVLTRLGWQVVGAATFSFNWVSLAGGDAYFSSGAPELFRNLWSLAVEEQFYLVWPLALPLVLLLPRRALRVTLVAAVAVASAAGMAALVLSHEATTRVYFGTDTHAFGILGGAALAIALDAPRSLSSRAARLFTRGAGVPVMLAGVGGLVAVSFLPSTPDVATFPGALLVASGLTLAIIAVSVVPGSRAGRLLDAPALRWIGLRSYGLYLWHWPILVLLGAASGSPTIPPLLGLAALGLTVLAAAASYRLVEEPIRRLGLRGASRRLTAALAGPPHRRTAAIAGIAVGALALGGTSAAIAAAPPETAAETSVEAGREALEAAPAPDSSPTPAPAPSAESALPGAVPSPAPTAVPGSDVTAVGDSVMLASAPALLDRFPGIHVDAEVSRSMYAGPGILDRLRSEGALRRVVVVALGTNGSIERETLDDLRAAVGPERELVLVTAHAERDWIDGVNAELAGYAATHARVELADWTTAIAPREDLLAGDGIHPGDAGGRVFADTVADAISRSETERTQRVFRGGLSAWDVAQGRSVPERR